MELKIVNADPKYSAVKLIEPTTLVQKHESESGMGVQGALPPAGARGILSGGQVIGAPASFPFPKKVC